jgi:hypothetical protein
MQRAQCRARVLQREREQASNQAREREQQQKRWRILAMMITCNNAKAIRKKCVRFMFNKITRDITATMLIMPTYVGYVCGQQ